MLAVQHGGCPAVPLALKSGRVTAKPLYTVAPTARCQQILARSVHVKYHRRALKAQPTDGVASPQVNSYISDIQSDAAHCGRCVDSISTQTNRSGHLISRRALLSSGALGAAAVLSPSAQGMKLVGL